MVNGQKTGECGRKYLVSKQIAEIVRSVSGVVQKLNGPAICSSHAKAATRRPRRRRASRLMTITRLARLKAKPIRNAGL